MFISCVGKHVNKIKNKKKTCKCALSFAAASLIESHYTQEEHDNEICLDIIMFFVLNHMFTTAHSDRLVTESK